MKNFKVEVSKWVEKFTFIRQAEAELFLRETLHKEGFTILSIVQLWEEVNISWNKFLFDFITKDWEEKTWTIASSDLFKSYVKIKYSLWYNLKYIYDKKDTSINEKEKIIHDLEWQYEIFKEINKKAQQKEEDKINKTINTKKEEDKKDDKFYLQKELDFVYNILDKTLDKIKLILTYDEEFINFEKKDKLKNIYNELIKLKSSTNLAKLREIWETALLKIWEVELNILNQKKDLDSKALLKDTNKLLKKIGSKKAFYEDSKDLWKILWNYFNLLKSNLKNKEKKQKIDTTSTSFLKLKLTYDRYNFQLKKLNKECLTDFIVFIIPTKENKEKVEIYNIKRKVIKQNLAILEKRIKNQFIQYSKIVKWYDYIVWKVLDLLKFFQKPVIYLNIFYSFIFLIFFISQYFNNSIININYTWLFYFVYLNLVIFLLSLSRWIISMSFYIVILSFLFIFWVINF